MPIALEAGRKYYIEAIHKELTGSDNLSVGWQLPDGVQELPIPGNRLSPFALPAVNTPPVISLVYPSAGTVLRHPEGVPLTVTARIADLYGSVSKIEFYQALGNGPWVKISETTTVAATGLYTYSVSAPAAGEYAFRVVAVDNAGLRAYADAQVSVGTVSARLGAAGGSVVREYWANVIGNQISAIPVSTTPTSTSTLTALDAPRNVADNYGARIRGYLHPPADGYYTLWISSDDLGEFWLSTNDNPANKVLLTSQSTASQPGEWNRQSTQQSGVVWLKGGQQYYFEMLHKEVSSGDGITARWQLPNGTIESPIPGTRLSAFGTYNTPPLVSIAAPAIVVLPKADVTLTGTASDADGSVAAYQWEKVGGPNVTMSGQTTGTLKLTGLTAGVYTFRLTATDNSQGASYAQVKVRVLPADNPMWVDAGTDQVLAAPQNTTTLVGTTRQFPNEKGPDPRLVKSTYYVRDAQGNVLSIYERRQDRVATNPDLYRVSYRQAEVPLYGSDRLGEYQPDSLVRSGEYSRDEIALGLTQADTVMGLDTLKGYAYRVLGQKQYELKDHLGNVRVTVGDEKLATINSSNLSMELRAAIRSYFHYYPFGMNQPGGVYEGDTLRGYRYGFNSKEKDKELGGGLTSYDYGFRIYNPGIARFLSVDPLSNKFPWYTPFQFAGNNPIIFLDLDGAEEYHFARTKDKDGNTVLTPLGSNALVETSWSWDEFSFVQEVNQRKDYIVHQMDEFNFYAGGQQKKIPYDETVTYSTLAAAQKATEEDFRGTNEDIAWGVASSASIAAENRREYGGWSGRAKSNTAKISRPNSTPSTKARAKELFELIDLHQYAKDRGLTVSVADAVVLGKKVRIIAINSNMMKKAKVMNQLKEITKHTGEILVEYSAGQDAHAEQNLYKYAETWGIEIDLIDPSRKFCEDCETLRKSKLSRTNTSTTGKSSPKRMKDSKIKKTK